MDSPSDSQSIITQAHREEPYAEYPILSLPRPVPPGHSTPPSTPVASVKKKKSRRNRLLKLFCCLGQDIHRKPQTPLLCSPTNAGNISAEEVPIYRGQQPFLLPKVRPQDVGKKCIVIDLDETLVHSSFKPVYNADFIVPVEIDGVVHQVYVLKRPYVDEFLQKMGELFECVLFTASLAKYADPVADLLDKWGIFRVRLFRDSCIFHRGNFVKDLSRLGRDLSQIIIVDNSPASYILHPDNAVPVASWFDDMSDTELIDLIPLFESLATVDSAYTILRSADFPRPGCRSALTTASTPIH